MAAGDSHRHRIGLWPFVILIRRALIECTSTCLFTAAGQGLESRAVRLDDGDRDVAAFAGVDVTHGAFFPLVGSFHHAAKISVLYHALKEQKKTGDRIAAISRLVPGAGLEPARPFGSTDFKSVVSTNSTIQAGGLIETGQI